jgi:predicted Zn finger-like uncharacterized protein
LAWPGVQCRRLTRGSAEAVAKRSEKLAYEGVPPFMIVQCPECRARYRIRDSNVPASGGKIRCPSCSHSFVVYPEESVNDPTIEMSKVDRTAIASDSAMRDLVSTMQPSTSAPAWEDEGSPTQIVGGADFHHHHTASDAKDDGTGEMDYREKWDDRGSHLEEESEDDLDGMTQVVMPNVALPTRSHGDSSAKAAPTLFGTGSFPQPAAPENVPGQGYVPHSRSAEAPPQAQPLQSAPATLFGPAAIQIQQDRQGDSASFPQAVAPAIPTGLGAEAPFGADAGAAHSEFAVPPPLPSSVSAELEFSHPESGDPDTLEEGPNVDHDGPWKLQTNFGLAYEFPDTDGLRNWLSSREELDGYALSDDDGENYYSLSSFPKLSERRPTPTAVRAIDVGSLESSEGLAGIARFATSAIGLPKITANAYQPPSRDDESNKFLILVLFVLVGVAVPLVMNAAKLDQQLLGLNFKEVIVGTSAPKSSAAPNAAVEKKAAVAVPQTRGKSAEEQKADIDRTFKDAKRLLKNKRLQSALAKLEIVVTLDPSREDARELTAELYEKLGQSAKAEEIRNFGVVESTDAGTDQEPPAQKSD